ncbi:hypothetical protein F5148DRAFT_1147380 [Russula earlei]|uniref:Uncharacterized protein n=1 Tax=Russula earlei TaxID=71964 RepID=A0ACC0UFY6_9AGAM|nr:hypothetical protein F5148DRAFT_1147380 [Russula earlei]
MAESLELAVVLMRAIQHFRPIVPMLIQDWYRLAWRRVRPLVLLPVAVQLGNQFGLLIVCGITDGTCRGALREGSLKGQAGQARHGIEERQCWMSVLDINLGGVRGRTGEFKENKMTAHAHPYVLFPAAAADHDDEHQHDESWTHLRPENE